MGWLQNVFGRKPEVPLLPELSLPEEQQKAIDANIAAQPGAAQLARLSQEQIRDMMRFAFPGFDTAGGKVSGNILDMVQGKIPGDVAAMARIGSAGRSLSGGYASGVPGSMGSNLEARDLGLTSFGIMQQGQSSMEKWMTAMEQLYSPSQAIYSGMFITPMQEFAASTQERDLQFQRNWLVNQIKAMPGPVARGLHDTIMEVLGDVASMYGVGGGGGSGAARYTDTPNSQKYGGIGGGSFSGGGNQGGGNIWGWGGGSSGGTPQGGRGDLGDYPIPKM